MTPASRRATVVVPTYERARYLSDVLAALAGQDLEHEAWEVVVADNASTTGSVRETVAAHAGGPVELRYVADPGRGAHHARHVAARLARGEILVYIDDDVLMGAGWLRALLEPFEDPAVGCTGGRVVARWEAGGPPPWARDVPPHFFSLLDLGDEARDVEPPFSVNSCNMALRREALWLGGGFRPCVFGKRRHVWLAGDGEAGLVRRLQDLGVRVRYVPDAVVEHRIHAARSERSYARFRARIEGVEHSFTWTREADPSSLRHLRHGAASLARGAARGLRGDDVRAAYWWARGVHQLGVGLVPPFRRYVTKASYASE